ncbi:MAG: hypothetical protein GOMPHAMPRED_004520 [Gomphillus americanus]|uniref:Uncharacterized protein n=1 Tax=Gomphillus americanus TaxID=1940652 RepID=A0A8H3FKV1_9LECA|nr:MAG: hypothetical protein GOMPHAMPRED_004520 [Gomphillus americanus]
MSSGIIGTRATIALYVLGMYLALCCLKVILLSVQTTICETPGLGNLVHCPLPGKLDFKRLTIIQRKLEDVQEQVAEGMSLPLQLKWAEAVIMDAAGLAVVGDLPSKDEMKAEFNSFFQHTRNLGQAVRQANTITIKRLRKIERIEAAAKQKPLGLSVKSLNLFAAPEQSPRELVTRQYIWLLDESKDSVVRLDVQVNVVLQIIENIEASLHNLQQLCRYDEDQVNKGLREFHERFWTMFGFYKREIDNLKDTAQKIQELIHRKGEAYAIYSRVHISLQKMNDELVHLHTKLDLSALSFEPDYIAVKVHAEELIKTVGGLTSKRDWVRQASRKALADAQAQILPATFPRVLEIQG